MQCNAMQYAMCDGQESLQSGHFKWLLYEYIYIYRLVWSYALSSAFIYLNANNNLVCFRMCVSFTFITMTWLDYE